MSTVALYQILYMQYQKEKKMSQWPFGDFQFLLLSTYELIYLLSFPFAFSICTSFCIECYLVPGTIPLGPISLHILAWSRIYYCKNDDFFPIA